MKTVNVGQVNAYKKRVLKALKEEIVTFIRLRVPEATGALVQSYVNSVIFDNEASSSLPYAQAVENAVGRRWTKPTALDHAMEKCKHHVNEKLPLIAQQVAIQMGLKGTVITAEDTN